MASEERTPQQKNPEEFRPYRLALWIAYVSVGSLGTLLLVASVVVELFDPLGRASVEKTPSPTDLLQCNADVLNLLQDLAVTPAEIQREAAEAEGIEPAELGERWDKFSRAWDRRWNLVNVQCQFDELAETGLGAAFDRMAEVHRGLPGLKLAYREMMKRWNDNQAGRLAEMREALAKSRRLLEEQAETPPAEAPQRAPKD